MPAHSSVAKVRQGTPYRRLATNGGEKCELVTAIQSKVTLRQVTADIVRGICELAVKEEQNT
jgi:hypothetical protein